MLEEQIKKAADFLRVKVLNTLEEKSVVGGILPPADHHDHTDEGRHHSHHDHP